MLKCVSNILIKSLSNQRKRNNRAEILEKKGGGPPQKTPKNISSSDGDKPWSSATEQWLFRKSISCAIVLESFQTTTYISQSGE